MNYNSMYKHFGIDTEKMMLLADLTQKTMLNAPIHENVMVTMLVQDESGTHILNKEVTDAELV
jgi:hypothetical protein